VVTFAIAGLSPYANGTRIKLKIGNPTSAYIMKLKAHVSWGTSDGKSGYHPEGERDLDFDNLARGTWSLRTIDIPALPPSKFGFLYLSAVTPDSISLVGF